MRFIYAILITLMLASCASYQKYEQPTSGPVVEIEVDGQVKPSAFLKQKSTGLLQGLSKVMNAVNSLTLAGINTGVLSVNGQYISDPKKAHKYATIKPGVSEIKLASFLSGSSGSFYTTVNHDFKAGKKYVITVAPDGPTSIAATVSEK